MSFRVIPVPAFGCEDVAVATHGPDQGAVFTGTEDGSIWRIRDEGLQVDRVARTGGRPLGIEYDGDGRLVVCDATRGLLRVDPATGDVETLAETVAGTPILVCNNAAIATDGTIWFSDSSAVHTLDRWKDDFIQVTATGRLLRRDPGGEVEIVMGGLAFANGVALGGDEAFVAVAESSTRRVARHWVTGDRAGERDFLVEDLPGYPDNIARGSDGLIWIAIGSPTDPVVERVMNGPHWLRRQVTKIPEKLQPKEKQRAWVQAYDDTGSLVHDCDVDTRDFHMVTGVREHAGRVWMGSLHERGVAVLDL
jgi:sugar lactone lactonase YvrE